MPTSRCSLRDRVEAQLGQQAEGFDLAGRFHMRADAGAFHGVVADADVVFVGGRDRQILGDDGAHVGFEFAQIDPGGAFEADDEAVLDVGMQRRESGSRIAWRGSGW
jgi:hypothetical protein